ncbi:hypothetical protein TNCV_2521341 [Trichonephila clavipes]|nr:hypothetical protein TNCV_2521341 [Trichonephila clavipes]
MFSHSKIKKRNERTIVVVMSFPNGKKENCQSLRQFGLLHDRWRHPLFPPPQFKHALEGRKAFSSTRSFCCDRPQDFRIP